MVQREFIGNDVVGATELNPLEARSLVPVVHAPDICIILIYIILEKLFFLDICIILIYIMLEKKTFLPTRH